MANRQKPKGKGGPHHSRKVKESEIIARREKAMELHLAGKTYREIGEELGVKKDAVATDIAAVGKELKERTVDLAEFQKELNNERLEQLYALIHPVLFAPGGEIDEKLIREARGILQDKAKLWGLNAPTAVEHSGLEPVTIILPPSGAETKNGGGTNE